jgi:NADH-ubiquinone oxidoreductase chain 1
MILLSISTSLVIIITTLIAIAFFTLLERKILGYSHLRKGPNKVRFIGLLQPIADAVKLFLKELNIPTSSNTLAFFLAPILTLILAISIWILYPFFTSPIKFTFGVLLFLAISSVNVYSALIRGWLSNSKYALLGSLRGIAQTISYEVRISLIIISPIIFMKTFLLQSIASVSLIFISTPILLIIWLTSILAETNRTPFDLAEGESELVSGFNTEYRSGTFAIIFIGEYTRILAIRIFSAVFFIAFYNQFLSIISIITITIIISILFI